MNKLQYQEYLKSSHWRTMRRKALENAEHSCQLCNSDSELNVHHRTYDRIGHERLTDVIVLCRDCHAKFHDKLEASVPLTYGDDGLDRWLGKKNKTQDNDDWIPAEDLDMERDALKSVAGDGFGRWIELAWYGMCRKLGMSVPDAIEDVAHELNGGGYQRKINEDRRRGV